VLDQGVCIGSISEDKMSEILSTDRDTKRALVGEAMEEVFPTLPENADLKAVAGMLRHYKAVLVGSKGKIIGIVTKFDIMKALEL
jgi:predicted transcriptional regulator